MELAAVSDAVVVKVDVAIEVRVELVAEVDAMIAVLVTVELAVNVSVELVGVVDAVVVSVEVAVGCGGVGGAVSQEQVTSVVRRQASMLLEGAWK